MTLRSLQRQQLSGTWKGKVPYVWTEEEIWTSLDFMQETDTNGVQNGRQLQNI